MHGRSFLLAREEVTWFSITQNRQVTNSTKHLKRQCNLNTRSWLNNRDDQWYESGSISSRKSFFALRSFPCLAFACLGFVRSVKSKSKMIRSFCFFCERDSVAAFILFLVSWIYDYFSSQNKKLFISQTSCRFSLFVPLSVTNVRCSKNLEEQFKVKRSIGPKKFYLNNDDVAMRRKIAASNLFVYSLLNTFVHSHLTLYDRRRRKRKESCVDESEKERDEQHQELFHQLKLF